MISWFRLSFICFESSIVTAEDRAELDLPETGDVARELILELEAEAENFFLDDLARKLDDFGEYILPIWRFLLTG